MPRCPVCGEELIEVGHPDECGFQAYRCPNDCKFKPPLSWRVWNAVGLAIYVTLMVITLIPMLLAEGVATVVRVFRRRVKA